MGLVAVLELPEHVAGYAAHPAHLEWVFFPFCFNLFSFP